MSPLLDHLVEFFMFQDKYFCRLWLGTGNGVIISVPLSSPDLGRSTSGNLIADVIEKSKPGAPVRVYADIKVSFE